MLRVAMIGNAADQCGSVGSTHSTLLRGSVSLNSKDHTKVHFSLETQFLVQIVVLCRDGTE